MRIFWPLLSTLGIAISLVYSSPARAFSPVTVTKTYVITPKPDAAFSGLRTLAIHEKNVFKFPFEYQGGLLVTDTGPSGVSRIQNCYWEEAAALSLQMRIIGKGAFFSKSPSEFDSEKYVHALLGRAFPGQVFTLKLIDRSNPLCNEMEMTQWPTGIY